MVGSKGVAQYTLDGENYSSFEGIELCADESNLKVNTKKGIASYSGTRFNDYIDIDAEGEVYAGEDTI